MDKNLADKIQQLNLAYPDTRILAFNYQSQKYWLKKTEQNKGWMRLLKMNPNQALAREIQALINLNSNAMPVPKLVASGANYLVIEDVGRSLQEWLNDPAATLEIKQQLLNKASQALAKLHLAGFYHGRPALRDIAWNEQQQQIYFLDFESKLSAKNILRNQARDLIMFVHSLYRCDHCIDQVTINKTIATYKELNPSGYQYTQQLLVKFNWLYKFGLLFKKIARRDLIAAYKVFEFFKQN